MFRGTNTKIIAGDYIQSYIDRVHNKTATNMKISGYDKRTYEVFIDGTVFETATGYDLFKTNYFQSYKALTAEIADFLVKEHIHG